jgi:predicted DNA-binding protein (MmcQ/YjbR family)
MFALVFENLLILHSFFTYPQLLDYLDEVKAEVLTWPDTSVSLHKYGGLQFNYRRTELGHIHGNGLLDIRLNRKTKELLLTEHKVSHHHTFRQSGWISFYIRSTDDKAYAIGLLRRSYSLKSALTIQ